MNLTTLDNSRAVGEKVPQELLNYIQDNLISSIVANNEEVLKDIKDGISLRPHIAKIDAQLNELFLNVKRANSHFWPGLIKPGNHLSARPQSYSSGSIEEMQLALKYNYRSWAETPGAIELIQAKVEG